MEALTSMFNTAAGVTGWIGTVAAVVLPPALAYMFWPRQLKPGNETAKVVTARSWPNIFNNKEKIVAKNGAKLYTKWGASDVSDIPLKTFRVPIERKGKEAALRLKDNIKVEVDVEFFVRVDTDSLEGIVKALEALGGKIDEDIITTHCTSKFDAALRAAAINMDVDMIQTQREEFRNAVIQALDSLQGDGLKLNDVSLRRLDQSPIADFDKDNYNDSEGLKKIKSRTEDSRKIINDTEQRTNTEIKKRNQTEINARLTIDEEERKATLDQAERIKKMEAEQEQRIAEAQAAARQASEGARIASERQIGLADVQKTQELAVANANRERAEQEARLTKEKAIELADADKKIALHNKALEQAAAEKAANEQRAEAVTAAESVTTARVVAESERNKRVDVIAAEAEAQKASASERIAAETRVYVAEQGKIEAEAEAAAVRIQAQAAKDAAALAAEGAYAEIFQKAKAVADGKLAEASAQQAINDAVNKLSDGARQYLVDMARVEITPEAIREAMKPVEKIGNISITSMNGGLGGMFGGAAGGTDADGKPVAAAAPGGGGMMGEIVQAMLYAEAAKPMLARALEQFGGDKKIADNLPGVQGTFAASVVPADTVVIPEAQEQNNAQPVPAAAPALKR